MAKKIDPKAKAKKQKIYAAVGGVLLLAVLAFQVPRTLKMMHPPTDAAATTTPAATTPATTGAPIAAPSLSGGNATVAAAPGGDGLNDPDAVPLPQSGQLLAFGLFRTKDPFVQQLRSSCVAQTDPSGAGSPASTCSTKGTATTGPTGVTGPTGSSGPAKPVGGSKPSIAEAPPTSAVISVNGSPETVQAGGNFPTSDPIFTLISVTKTTVKIGIAGGSLENGSPAVTLQKNKTVTLMNTADGTRYVLRLLSVS
jgi:hypothetical protein